MPTRRRQVQTEADKTVFMRDPLWYKDATIYQLHVKSFFDSNNDGIGDFAGLIQKLDYIQNLGVNCIWLMPFYPSPLRDDGYDISEYCAVHPDYGTLDDVQRLIEEAHARKLRVVSELVINHTSDEHPWFQRARHAPPGSPEREFYVWSDNDQKYAGTRIIFLDTEKSNWAWDPVAQAYYWHRFYSHQPDLNFDNPAVLEAVLDVMEFWLDMGIDGLRLDAIPYLVEREGTNNENLPETHEVLKKIRAKIDEDYPDRMLLAEANQWPEDTRHYFGDGDECHMAFHFPLMPRMYMALAQEDRFPITDILRQTPDIPDNCQWAIFLRNHDELTLEMVTDRERDYLWAQYASDERARINLGIRRRLAPLMQQDRRRLELLHSLLLTMPGSPILYYGDEIGMGDNIFLGDRDGVRTPMQWTPDRNGGFSRADPAKLMLPAIMDAQYGYIAVNVEAQSLSPHSFLNWLRLMLDIRQVYKAFGRGTFKMLFPSNRRVLAYIREYAADLGSEEEAKVGGETILCLANMSRAAQAVELDLGDYAGMVPLELSGGSTFPPIGALPYLLTLPPHGFYWFLLAKKTAFPEWYNPPPEPMPEFLTLVLRNRVSEVCEMPMRSLLETQILPAYLPKRRWFAGKHGKIQATELVNTLILQDNSSNQSDEPIILSEVQVELDGEKQRYQLPLTVLFEDAQHPHPALVEQLALARVRRRRKIGLLTDAMSTDNFSHWIIQAMQSLDTNSAVDPELQISRLAFHVTPDFSAVDFKTEKPEIRHLSGEQSNTSVVVAEEAVLKVFRRLHSGPHPEVEISEVLAANHFTNTGSLLGYVTREDPDGDSHVLAVLQRYIPSQGDGWEWLQGKLERYALEEPGTTGGEVDWSVTEADLQEELTRMAATIGQRLAEMHSALSRSDAPSFVPVRADAVQCEAWSNAMAEQFTEALAKLRKAELDDSDRLLVQQLERHQQDILDKVKELSALGVDTVLIRIHGDLHLGQILIAQDDAYFIDFEGEPAKTLDVRRAKASPLRDVAGVLRSFDYAAELSVDVFGDYSPVTEPERLLAKLEAAMEKAFLDDYFATENRLIGEWRDQKTRQALTSLFTIEKAIAEINYEAANRPDWISIPLHGLTKSLAASGVSFQS